MMIMSSLDIVSFLVNICAIFYETKSLILAQKSLLPPYHNVYDSCLVKQ